MGAPRGRASTIPPSPDSSPKPYSHPPIQEWEMDINWSEYEDMEITSKMAEEIKKSKGKLSCVDQSSTIS